MPMIHNRSFTDEQFIEAVKTSESIAQVLKKLNLCTYGANYRATKILVKSLNLSTEHFTGQGHLKGKTHSWTKGVKLEDILIENSIYSSISSLKSRLIKELKWEYKCVECGLTDEWNNKKLSLHLDHINGNNMDHRKENLRFLCPNCHSQTHTYCGRNKPLLKKEKLQNLILEEPNLAPTKEVQQRKKREVKIYYCSCGSKISKNSVRCGPCNNRNNEKTWPSKEELEKLVWKKPLDTLAIELNVSDTAIIKRCRKLQITKPPQGYWLSKKQALISQSVEEDISNVSK